MKTKKFGISLHLVVLLIALLLSPPSFERLTSSFGEFVQFLISLAFLLVMFYVCFLWLVPAYLSEKRTGLFVLMAFIMANLATLAGYTNLQLAHLGLIDKGDVFHYGLAMHISGLHAMIYAAAFGSLFRVVYEWYRSMPAEKNK